MRYALLILILMASCQTTKKVFESEKEVKTDSITKTKEVERIVETKVYEAVSGSIGLGIQVDTSGVAIPFSTTLDLGKATIKIRQKNNKLTIEADVDKFVDKKDSTTTKSVSDKVSKNSKERIVEVEVVRWRSRWYVWLGWVFFVLLLFYCLFELIYNLQLNRQDLKVAFLQIQLMILKNYCFENSSNSFYLNIISLNLGI